MVLNNLYLLPSIKINNTVEKHDKSDISIDNFLVNKGETAIEKYGDILTKVIDLTK